MTKVVNIGDSLALEAGTPNQAVIDQCRDLLEMAESGELQGMCGGLQMSDRSTGTLICGEHTTALIGAIEKSKFRMLIRNEAAY